MCVRACVCVSRACVDGYACGLTNHGDAWQGAVVVVLDLPVGTEFGLDYNVWNVGPKFRGVMTVPPGVHFVFHASSAGGGGRQTGPRSGEFLHLSRGDVVVRRFNPLTEELLRADDVELVLRGNRQSTCPTLAPKYGTPPRSWPSLFAPSIHGVCSFISCINRYIIVTVGGVVIRRRTGPWGTVLYLDGLEHTLGFRLCGPLPTTHHVHHHVQYSHTGRRHCV
jgi:hypothetical protein